MVMTGISLKKSLLKDEHFMKKLKKIPKFKTVSAEQNFWQERDSTSFIDWTKAKDAQFPKLKPSTKTISLVYNPLPKKI
jgi:hypothetical protein